MKRQSFIAGTSILIGASLITRILGFIYRVALSRLIGAEGIGLFQMVFPVLTLILTIVSAGMGVAISKLVAESVVTGDRVRIRRVLQLASGTTILLSALATVVMVLFGHAITQRIFTDPRAFYPFITLTPVIGIIAISSVLRGYFQGLQIMSTPSIAAIIETIIRIVGVWLIAAFSLTKGLEYAASAVSAGMILGELAGCVYMLFVYRYKARIDQLPLPMMQGEPESFSATVRAITQIIVPVTFSRFIGSIAFAVEPMIVTRALLTSGVSAGAATRLYGEYGGMAIPLLVFPTVFTYSLAVQLVPSISEAVAAHRHNTVARRLNQSFRATALIGFPTSLILLQFATPLCQAIFKQPQVGTLLAIMAPCGFLLYLQGPLSGILQGINRAGVAMRNSLIGSAVKLIMIYFLASRPTIGVAGVAWALTVAVSLTTVLHIASIHRLIGFYASAQDTGKMLVATAIIGFVMEFLWRTLSSQWPLSLTLTTVILSGAILYTVILLMTRTIHSQMFRRIPKIGVPLAKLASLLPFAR